MESEMETTKELLKDFEELRDTIVELGPNDRLLARLSMFEVELRARRIEQVYLSLKEEYPDPIEYLELAEPLSDADLQALDEAEGVHQEIHRLVNGSKKRRKKSAH